MPGWSELSSYSVLATLLFGLLTAFSFWGVGRLVCWRALAPLPDFLRLPAECVAGAIVTGLLVQVMAMCDVSRSAPMRMLWMTSVAAAVLAVICSFRARSPAAGWRPTLWWAPAALMAAVLLLAGSAPESRSDEIAYHALVSARPLVDGGLHFYPLPWEASVLPQMLWHFASIPLYAISGSAAAGVTSASIALLLAWAMGRLMQWQTGSDALAAVAAFITLASGYSIVFFTTTGPHAFGYLAVFVAVTAVGWSSEIRAAAGARAYALAVAVGCGGAVASKITMLPVAAVVSCFALVDIARDASVTRERSSAVWVALVPAVCLLVPALWTWAAAGSPLGALTARLFHAPTFDAETLSAYEGTRELFADRFQWRFEAAYWSLPLVLGALLALWIEPVPARRLRWQLIGGCQALLIIFVLPHEIRHFGGIQYPLMASGLASLAVRARARGYSFERVAKVGAVAALPWALFVLWVASIYLPLAGGRMTAEEFLRRYSGLQIDYEVLDKTLPRNAVLLIGRSRSDSLQYAWYSRPPVYYAPRPVLFTTSQAAGHEHVYVLYLGAGAQGTRGAVPVDPWLPAGSFLGPLVYSNPEARFYPSRTPGGNAGLARLDVFELLRN